MPEELFRARPGWAETLLAAAEQLDLDVVAVEKDYWVCQVLRGLATGPRGASVVFKGGTSLEKLRLTQRFSEDIDALVVVPAGLSKNQHAKHLKLLAADAVVDGLAAHSEQLSGGNPGSFHRNVWLHYRETPETGTSGLVDDGRILLELGESGGPSPQLQHDVTSLVGRQLELAGVDVTAHADLRPFRMCFLHPGRTLLEKLLRVEAFITDPSQARDPDTEWKRIGRQLYDIWALLGDERVHTLLEDREHVRDILDNAATISQAFSMVTVERPTDGFAASVAYDPHGPWSEQLREEHERAMAQLYYGRTPPTFDDVCGRIALNRDKL